MTTDIYPVATINEIGKTLIRRKQTIAIAESVTAGHLQAALSLAENARRFFHGGGVAYNLGQKATLLHIDPIHAEECNCVSPAVATQMALGIAALFHSTLGVAITGYAAPVPEYGIEKLYAHYAIVQNGQVLQDGVFHEENNEPLQVQLNYVDKTLHQLKNILSAS